MKPLIILSLALLAGCGGGGSSAPVPVPVPDIPPVAETVLFRQVGTPILVNSPGGAWAFPRDVGYVATFDLGPLTFTWDANGLGVLSDSWAAPAGSSHIKTVNYQWTPSVPAHPWADGSNASVCTSITASVPQSYRQDTPGNYVGGDIWLEDGSTGKATSGKRLIISTFIFDHNRPQGDNPPGDYIVALGAVQFAQALGSPRITTTAGAFRQQTWAEPERFGFCVNRDQVLFMLAASVDLFGGMADVHDMVVVQALISNETALPGPSSQDRAQPGATLTTYFSDWTVSILGAQ